MARNRSTWPKSPATGTPSRRALFYVLMWRPQERRANGGDTPTPGDEYAILLEDGTPLLMEDGTNILLEDQTPP